jgi:hypothetical protein
VLDLQLAPAVARPRPAGSRLPAHLP